MNLMALEWSVTQPQRFHVVFAKGYTYSHVVLHALPLDIKMYSSSTLYVQ